MLPSKPAMIGPTAVLPPGSTSCWIKPVLGSSRPRVPADSANQTSPSDPTAIQFLVAAPAGSAYSSMTPVFGLICPIRFPSGNQRLPSGPAVIPQVGVSPAENKHRPSSSSTKSRMLCRRLVPGLRRPSRNVATMVSPALQTKACHIFVLNGSTVAVLKTVIGLSPNGLAGSKVPTVTWMVYVPAA